MRRLAASPLFSMLAACSPQYRVVRLDHEDGPPSSLIVGNAGGVSVLDQAGAAVEIERPTSAPKALAISDADIRQTWADALAYHPIRPITMQLYFILDTPNLTPASRAELPKVIDLIRQRPAPEVVIVCHNDR